MRRIKRALATAVVALAAMGLGALAAQAAAAASPVDPEIAAMLEAIPGGEVVDADHASWPEIGMQMTSADAATSYSVGSCATGSVCAYSGIGLTGAKLSWTTCGTFSTGSLTTRSIADARSSGHLQARNGTTVVATANAGASANVFSTVTDVRCVS